ncbi:hypothetical protein VNO78_10549 [Psophocarpus tetragonolobus]|uniref:Uncharacterized protein n=1 Tax=Psophocarpus tetragonolobus TaxID=3891 RepID=A0AAN9XN32_PSOTE
MEQSTQGQQNAVVQLQQQRNKMPVVQLQRATFLQSSSILYSLSCFVWAWASLISLNVEPLVGGTTYVV